MDSLDADHGLMNQESQTVDSTGLIHVIISYVPGAFRDALVQPTINLRHPGRFTQCVENYETDRPAFARPFHVYRSANGTFTKVEIPFAIQSVGRSQIVMDAADNVYVVLPFVRVVTASKASGWTDWTMVYNGTATGLNAFGEVTLDRARIPSAVMSVLYQQSSSGPPSAVKLIDFTLNG